MISRTKFRVCAAAVVAAIGTLSVGVAPSSAISAGTCVMVDLGGELLLNPWPSVTSEFAVELPAGEVSIPEAVSTDSYPDRVNVLQTAEVWELQFLAADGRVIATSATTEDLPDLVEDGIWVGSLGTVDLPEPAVAVRAHHRPDVTEDNSPNSVHPTGVTLCFDAPPVQPPTDGRCLLNDDGSFVDPTDPDCTPPTPECPTDDAGVPIDPTAPGCPTPPAPPEPTPECPLNDDGTPVDPTAPGCPDTPDPLPPTQVPECPLNDDGTPVDPTDPDCPDTPTTVPPTTEPPATTPPTTDAPDPLPPTQTPPTDNGPGLPVTGASSTAFALTGAWLLAAGAALTAFGRTRRTA